MNKGTCGPFTTKIGKYEVPVMKYNHPAVYVFKDNTYAFWTCIFKINGKNKKVWGRAQIGLSAGDRFDRMGRQKDIVWEAIGKGKNVTFVRPSTKAEIKKWLQLHPKQSKFLIKEYE